MPGLFTRTRSNAQLELSKGLGSEPSHTKLSNTSLKVGKTSLSKKLLQSSTLDQKQACELRFNEKYPKDRAKDIQLETTVSLINGQTTFLLAGTGFGKSRIPELFFHLFAKVNRPVILVLNPLDALGYNQVLEKNRVGISAINLTKTTFDKRALQELKDNIYSFVYLSPEFFLNNDDFQDLYHSRSFQQHLVLKVVDEAHCIYLWGLQESGKSHNYSTHVTPQDVGTFRPSYGKLGDQLMATDNAPLLLMSATCRPTAVHSILESLKIIPRHINIIRGELTRPEIRLIRIYLKNPLISGEDLTGLFPHAAEVPNDSMIPTIIYSGTRNATLPVMEAVCKARGDPLDAYNGQSHCIRRYHSVTGEKDKVKHVEDFGNGKFPILSATSALGLGQNWPWVRMVIVMGAMDPAESNQMVGRAGRGVGGQGIGILLVQPTMPSGTNSAADINVTVDMNNKERMHALRLTPCCLRVAYSVDNLKGYIPVSLLDSGYLEECERERHLNMPRCRCSSCDPNGAARVIRLLPKTSIAKLDDLLASEPMDIEDTNIFDLPKASRKRICSTNVLQVCKKDDPIRIDPLMIELAVSLVGHFERLFEEQYPTGFDIDASDLLTREDVWSIVKNEGSVGNRQMLACILGGELLQGLFNMIKACIVSWHQSEIYLENERLLEDRQVELDQAELNQELLEEARVETMKMKMEQKRLREIRLQASRVMREEKATKRLNKRKLNENDPGKS